ncbi:hypothetical protein Acr_03g0015680 [Actinidia rufa]|uniref:Uncharacterized protein n=1 Tax=Actinidia rufa TaxID=165716 RepID=A0A7J0EE74_9ERIC|nr:hypothetical protein Acr_03g0015680 [Actinidia rufa]
MLSNPEDSDGKNFTLGNLNDNYWTMNKIVHYNIHPKGSEKLLGKKEIACLHMVMGDRVFDAIPLYAIPFFVWRIAKWERPMVGPTTEASQEKSKSLSKFNIPPLVANFLRFRSSSKGYKSPLEEVAMEQVQEVRSKRRNEIVEEREEVEEDENEEESEDETGDGEEEDEGSEDIEDENGKDE